MRNFPVLFLLFFHVTLICGQNFSFDEELRLANHLLNTNNDEEAIHHLKNSLDKFSDGQENKDTLNFLLGYAYYQQREFDESNKFFLRVSEKSASYNQARFTSIYNDLYVRKYTEAGSLLNQLHVNNNLHKEYQAMQKAGLALLRKEFNTYKKSSNEFTYKYFQIENEQKELDKYYDDLISFKPKSMAVAGLLSTVVPGTGKMYAGKLGEGMSALLIVSILGGITAENYIKNGINDYKTIAFGSMFSIFYLGNIYGSVVSVKVYRDEFYKTYERKILVNLHIPLRNIFY